MNLDDLKHAQRERLDFLDRCLTWRGSANRRDLIERFGISNAQAAIDFRTYIDRSPTPPRYDAGEKRYLAARDHVAFSSSSLQEIFGVIETDAGRKPSALPQPERQMDREIIARIYQAIRDRCALSIRYTSMQSGARVEQWIAPVRFTSDGESIHLRAWSERHTAYRDYLPIRIDPDSSFAERKLDEPLPYDEDWNTLARIWLRPKHTLSDEQAAVVRREYGFEGALLLVETRKAMEFYFDRRWHIGEAGSRLERERTEYLPI